MKKWLLLFLAVSAVAVAAVGSLLPNLEDKTNSKPTLQLTSNPFPLAVGSTILYFTLENADSISADYATIQITNRIESGGELVLSSPIIQSANGQFAVPVTYPRMGEWTIDVAVEFADGQDSLHERYLVFVYGVSSHTGDGSRLYRSVSEIETLLASKASEEYWIIIPQGTKEITMHSLNLTGADLVPSEIYLSVSGQNTLVIQNDDVDDHTIGPYFVRSGETIRQKFSQPAVYQGVCSIGHNDEISIIVES